MALAPPQTADAAAASAGDVAQLRYEHRELERKIEAARQTWAKAEAFLKAHGLASVDDIPF